MILTWTTPATQERDVLDALNRASAEVYNRVLVRHWRYYRNHGVWMSTSKAERVDDALHDTDSILHSHSIDAAQQGFYKAIQTARELRKQDANARFPYKRKRFRSTIFKSSQLKRQAHQVRLAMANRQYLFVDLPTPLLEQHNAEIKEARLVYNRQSCSYEWNLVVEDGLSVPLLEEGGVMGVDLGEIHPAVCATPQSAAIISCRELRSTVQHRNKCLAELQSKMSKCQRYSARWHKLRRAKVKRRARWESKVHDLEHKISRAVVSLAVRQGVKVIALGDVRNIGDGKRLNAKSQQKISQWSHGRMRSYITYKAARYGIAVVLVSEAYTSQTCPKCGQKHKPKGRVYRCANEVCGFVGHRDVVGASNIWSKHSHNQVGGMYPPFVRVLHPFDCRKTNQTKVSGVCASSVPCERSHVAWEQLPLF
jgi:putative transposase